MCLWFVLCFITKYGNLCHFFLVTLANIRVIFNNCQEKCFNAIIHTKEMNVLFHMQSFVELCMVVIGNFMLQTRYPPCYGETPKLYGWCSPLTPIVGKYALRQHAL